MMNFLDFIWVKEKRVMKIIIPDIMAQLKL